MTAIVPESSPCTRVGATEAELGQLRDTLKRCSPATLAAACAFRRTRDGTLLPAIVLGVIERYVERDRRPGLSTADDNVRLIEDLGLDSLTMIEIVVLLEDVLLISVSNEELTRLSTLGDVRRFVAAKATAGSAT